MGDSWITFKLETILRLYNDAKSEISENENYKEAVKAMAEHYNIAEDSPDFLQLSGFMCGLSAGVTLAKSKLTADKK